jgi:hypothetical protein
MPNTQRIAWNAQREWGYDLARLAPSGLPVLPARPTKGWTSKQSEPTDQRDRVRGQRRWRAGLATGGARGSSGCSGARKGLTVALTGSCSRGLGGRQGQLNAAGVLAWAFLVLAAMTGCRGDSGETTATPIPPPSTTAAPPSSTVPAMATTLDPAAEVVARYRQFWDVRFDANRDPVNPADPRFAQLAVDPQLANVVTETRQRREQGLALRRPDPSVTQRRVKVVEMTTDTATLQDCATNDGIVYRVATGQVLDDSVVTRSVSATMRRVDGTWRLAEARVLQEWKGVAGCALSGGFS